MRGAETRPPASTFNPFVSSCCGMKIRIVNLLSMPSPSLLAMSILPATLSDIPDLLTLVNSAFRGDAARQGWTHEADLLQGEVRTDETSLRELLEQPGGTILKYCSDTDQMEGCVYLQLKANELYLGMLTVAPAQQGGGIGKLLLAAAEAHARQSSCAKIRMRVLSTRHELIAWYERHGYRPTGETEPYAFDHKFGVPTQPLEFVMLEKMMNDE